MSNLLDFETLEAVLLSNSTEDAIVGQMTNGIVANIRTQVNLLDSLTVRLTKEEIAKGASYKSIINGSINVSSRQVFSVKDIFTRTYKDHDACVQPGLVFIKIVDTKTNQVVRVAQVRGRADNKSFVLSPLQQEGVALLNKEGFDISLHYVQTIVAIDLDLRDEKGDKVKLNSIKDQFLKIGKKLPFDKYIMATFIGNELCEKHLLSYWRTEHGYRVVFRITPVETHSTTSKPFSDKIRKVDPKFTQDFYRGLSASYFKKEVGESVELEDGRKVVFDWDVGSTSNVFGLARLGKIMKENKEGGKVDLTSTDVVVIDDTTPIDLFDPANKHLFKEETKRPELKGEEMIKGENAAPAQFKELTHKGMFVSELCSNFISNPLLTLYSKSPVMPYEAWFKILASFRRLRQTLDEMGMTEDSQKITQLAIDWSRASKGWDNSAQQVVEKMIADDHQATFSAQSIQDSMGSQFMQWMQTADAKTIIKDYKGWMNQSIYTNAFNKSFKKFQTDLKYNPTTGQKTLIVGKPFFDDEGNVLQPKMLTPGFASKILESDPLLPLVMKYSVHAERIIVAPNIQNVLESALDNKHVEANQNYLTWSPMTDYHACSIRQYLDGVYRFKSSVKADHLEDLFAKIKDPTGNRYDNYKINLVAEALKARYEEWTHFKTSGDSVYGTCTAVLDEWLPTILNINPTKSPSHKKLYDLYSAYGRKFMIGMVQRSMATNVAATVENLLFLRGPAGAGKSRLVKQLVSSLFYGQNSVGSLGRASDFICEATEIPKDKDQLLKTFGTVLLMLDDISTDILKKTEQGFLKSFLTSSTDAIRLPYARETIYKNRTFATIATSNSLFLLSDLTSTRRNFIVDLDAISPETNKYICDLAEQGSITPVERVAGEQNGGMISIQHHARLIALAFGEAYARGCLGEIEEGVDTQEYHPIVGNLGFHDLDEVILVERPYLSTQSENNSKEWLTQFQIANIGIEDSGNVLNDFLRSPEGLGSKTLFELHELKNYFKIRQEQVPGDNSIKLWASQGIKAPNGEFVKIINRRVTIDGQRKSVWTLQLSNGTRPLKNPFFTQRENGQWGRDDSYSIAMQNRGMGRPADDRPVENPWTGEISRF